MKWRPQKFNDTLALVSILGILALFAAQGLGWLPSLPEIVTGALVSNLGLIFIFYYRKAKTDSNG